MTISMSKAHRLENDHFALSFSKRMCKTVVVLVGWRFWSSSVARSRPKQGRSTGLDAVVIQCVQTADKIDTSKLLRRRRSRTRALRFL